VAVRVFQRLTVLVHAVLRDGLVLDDAPVRVAAPRHAAAQQVLEVGLLGHDRIAALARRVHQLEVLRDRSHVPVGGIGRAQDRAQQGAHVQALSTSRPSPAGGLGPAHDLRLGRVVVQERGIALVGHHLVDGERPAHIRVVPVPAAHVLDRGRMVGLVEHVGPVDLGGEARGRVQPADVRVVHVLCVEEHDAQVPLPVEELDVLHVREEGRAARQAQPALVRGHSRGNERKQAF
jgi:hypothetical protein